MAFGTTVGLGSGDFVLDGDPARPSPKTGQSPPPVFGPFLLWLNGWMHQDATWHGVRPNFPLMSVVTKRLVGLRCRLVSWYGATHRPRQFCVR